MFARMPLFAHRQSISLSTWRWFYLLLALLIAIKVMANQHGWLNNDSLLYFEQARLLAAREWSAAFQLFSWPLYAGLVAIIHTLSGLEIQTAAQCLNAACFVVFVAGFQQLLLVAGAKQRTLHWGVWLLFSTTYLVGDVLGMLLRDEGFWAAYTWGLVFWCRYAESHQLKHALAFQTCMVIATLFRIEAVAYLVAIPLLSFIAPAIDWRKKINRWLMANVLALTVIIILIMAIVSGVVEPQQLGRLQEVRSQITQLFTHRLDFIHQKADMLGQQVLGNLLDDYAKISLWSALLLITLLKTVKVAGYPTLILLAWPKRAWWGSINIHMQRLMALTLITGLVVSTVIILNTFVLSSRYVIASGIVMLCMAAFAISHFERCWPRWVIRLWILIMALMALNNVWNHRAIDLDRDAVNAVKKINAADSRVFYDTENARFYAKQPFLNRIDGYKLLKQTEANGQIDAYDIYVISPHHDIPAYESYATHLLNSHHYVLTQTLYGWRKKSKAYIFIKSDKINAGSAVAPAITEK